MKKAKWIWVDEAERADEYVKFYDVFECAGDKASIEISCDSNYVLYVNGVLSGFGQYPDYPHYKVYDKIDISGSVRKGKNSLLVIVWYYGTDFMTYVKAHAGLIYEVTDRDRIAAFSKRGTLCAAARDFVGYEKKLITTQLGFSFRYDSRQYDGYDKPDFRPAAFAGAVEAKGISYTLYPRPVKKLLIEDMTPGKPINGEGRIFDLGRETVGFLHIKFQAPTGARVVVSYGEHLNDGAVRRIIGNRDFSAELIANGEWFEYTNCFRRLAARFLQVDCDEKIEIEFIGIRETGYPLRVTPFRADTPLRQQIYDTAVRTLALCMHDHYEDCPWREQALYTMDSRNQMLCGYYAFEEFEFARANLLLMSKAQKSDKLLPLCFPAGNDVPIPFFSLIYLMQMKEYAQYSGDLSLLEAHLTLLNDIADVFIGRIDETGLIPSFEGYWNFYEWSDGLDGIGTAGLSNNDFYSANQKNYALPLNCHAILALKNLNEIYSLLDRTRKIPLGTIENLQKKVFDTFFVAEKGAFKSFSDTDGHYSNLCNALAVLSGCAAGREREVCRRITDGGMNEATLSMKMFEYDALLQTDAAYAGYVLDDIDKLYGHMLRQGATSFWETIKGEADFDGAGSLCHGWSAIPVYYYWRLLGACLESR
ncbi:MAG: family 78 glycoside hydrolase catalytic domain [Clostridiales bacterium]|jgi:hypothetical protein|nr:family 78 glycoside hydrolase catalytic domain [Clostridiales bacterium]